MMQQFFPGADMKSHQLEIMKKVLRPISKERAANIARFRTTAAEPEQPLAQDAGVEKELRALQRRIILRRAR